MAKECCNNCKFLAELWYWEGKEKKTGCVCTMLAKTDCSDGKETYMQIYHPESDICEMFTEKE